LFNIENNELADQMKTN